MNIHVKLMQCENELLILLGKASLLLFLLLYHTFFTLARRTYASPSYIHSFHVFTFFAGYKGEMSSSGEVDGM
jgi:hypothetical protein